jgi:hypothetical protein
MDVDYMIMQSNKRKSINTSKHTYTGTMVETANFFWIASEQYKYAILKQSLEYKSNISWVNPHSRTWRRQCRVYFLLYHKPNHT